MKKRKREQSEYKTEEEIIRNVRKQWKVSVRELSGPYHRVLCLVDPHKQVLAWLCISPGDPKAEPTVDIRNLTGAMPFVWASGKPLILVASSPDGLRYAIWRPGIADFRPYEPDHELRYEAYWDAVIPAAELKPLGRRFPVVRGNNLGVDTIPAPTGTGETPIQPSGAVTVIRGRRRAKEKWSQWADVIR